MSVIFDNTNLNTLVGVKVVGTNELGAEPRTNTLIDVPGRDYPYDFGNNYKDSFPIVVNFRLIEEGESNLNDAISNLKAALSQEEAKTLSVYGQSYTAQIYDGVQIETNAIRNTATATVIFECWVEPA